MQARLDGELACVDLETTGGNAHFNRVIEVGIVLLSGGEVIEEWSSLVNPGTRIPGNIAQFTGISNDMVEEAPPFAALRDEILGRLTGRLFVAHNARFDYGFLRSEFNRLGVRYNSPVLCTVKLSRRVSPGIRGHGLDAVIERHGLACTARHRALGDARVLADFLARLRCERDPGELDSLVTELTREARLPPQLDPQLADDLPEGPGVYRFLGEDGALLYVGKSNNLRTRVLSHFAGDHRSGKELRLSRQVRAVDWIETAGEFGALLREARLIKEQAPLHNRRLRKSGRAWVIRLRQQGEALRADVVTLDRGEDSRSGDVRPGPLRGTVAQATAELHGPFRSERDARRALEELVRAHALCPRALGLEPGGGSCFGFQVGRCRGACCGKEPLALHAARARMAMMRHKLRSWPFRGRIAVTERDWRGLREMHVFDRWRYLGTVSGDASIDELPTAESMEFDLDSYRILSRYLDRPHPRTGMVELD
jgi:DNA polymerase-3 subunit epsilon